MRGSISLCVVAENVTFKFAFEQFVRIKKNRNLSADTILHYNNTLKHFTKFFDEENHCSSITSDTIEDYIALLREKTPPLADRTINTYLGALRSVLYFFMQRGYMPKFKISLVRQEKKVKEVYTEAELQLLLRKPDIKKCGFPQYRNWVLTNYLLATGNRLRTVCNVKIKDIDFQNQEILLTSLKNKRQYVIPLSSRLEKVLAEYQLYRKGELDDYLFCNSFGEKLTKDGISSAIERYNKSREVAKTSIHLYRHTFAKNWILNGGDIFRLKSILGHSSLDIVKEYAEMFGADLKRDFDEFNPLDNLGQQKYGRQGIKMTKRAN
jgi:integrase/recombinase XerD